MKIFMIGKMWPVLSLLVLLVLAPGEVLGQAGPLPPGSAAPSDAMHSMGQGQQDAEPMRIRDRHQGETVSAQIAVMQRQHQDDNKGAPEASTRVTIEWRGANGRPTDMAVEAATSTDGLANFEAVVLPRNQQRFKVFAVVEKGGVSFETELNQTMRPLSGTVMTMPVTGDPSVVSGGMMITVMQIPENMTDHPASYGYVMIQQIIELQVTDWVVYDSDSAKKAADARGVRLETPIKAGSLVAQAIGGGGNKVEVADSTLYYQGQIWPTSPGQPQSRIMARFFLKANGSELDYEQPIALSFADVRVAFIRDTDLPEFPILDIELETDQFSEISTDAQEGILAGRRVILARGLTLEAGSTLELTVKGLPYPEDKIPLYLSIVCGLLVIGGVWLAVRENRRRKRRQEQILNRDPEALAAIDRQIDALYAGLAELERDSHEGEIDEEDYLLEQHRLKTRIAVLKQRRDGTGPEVATG